MFLFGYIPHPLYGFLVVVSVPIITSYCCCYSVSSLFVFALAFGTGLISGAIDSGGFSFSSLVVIASCLNRSRWERPLVVVSLFWVACHGSSYMYCMDNCYGTPHTRIHVSTPLTLLTPSPDTPLTLLTLLTPHPSHYTHPSHLTHTHRLRTWCLCTTAVRTTIWNTSTERPVSRSSSQTSTSSLTSKPVAMHPLVAAPD